MILLVLMPLAGTSDQIYRWTDEKGVVHFSSKPIDESLDHELMPIPDAPTPTPGSQRQETDDAKEAEQKAPRTVETSGPTQEEIEYCKKLTTNINTLKNSPRVRIKKANGEFEILGDEGKKAEMDRLNKLMKEFC